MTADGTHSASSERRAWVVPPALRPTLQARYGPVFSGPAAENRLRMLRVFATCGDRVTTDAIRVGNLPLIGIVDGKTQRKEPVDRSAFAPLAARHHRHVRNPAGMLTYALRRAVREMVAGGGGLLDVDGEEDLASLALVESMPLGSTVAYGVPGEGVMLVTVDEPAKEHVRGLLALMERRDLPAK
ncbi:MAG: DUF359 domain-containing protein [Thermoplasmata archaeon]|nr:DUF359 domain-containing protein [Thermoplasmata archaeon]